MGSGAGKWMPRLSSRCTGLFSILTLTPVHCLAAGRRGTTAVIISRPYWCRPGEGQSAVNRRYLECSEPPLLPVQRSGTPRWRPWPLGGRLPVAHRNRVRDGEERCGFRRVRDAHLGRLASPSGPVPAGRGVSSEPATGLEVERCRGSRGRRCTGWFGGCCPGTVRAG